MRVPMEKKFIKILIIVLPCIAFSQGVTKNVSKVGTSAAPFLEIPVGAVAVGMGGAFVSIANDATALYWNVAGITALEQSEVVGIHNEWIAGTSFDFVAIVLKLGSYGAFGLNITSLSMDDMKVRTIDKPEGTGEFFSAGDIQIGLSYASKLTDRFSIGFTAKYIQQKIWHMKSTAVAVDFGTTFQTDLFRGMTIGASISNFGSSMKLSGRDTRRFSRIDETISGSNERIPHNIEMDSWDLPLLFQIGVSTNVMESNNLRLTVAVDALHPSDDYESLNIGTELAFQERVFIRGGYQNLFLVEAEGGLGLGVGMNTYLPFSRSKIKLDYAYRDMGRLKSVQLISISVSF